jgi:RHH-type transcriptional regulator, rel operon repressor / antitoxin RelB
VFTLNTHRWRGEFLLPSKSATFSVRLADDVRLELDALARATRRSRSFIVNEAVTAFVRARADYLRELDEAVGSAKSGVGYSGALIFEWMRSWGGADELPAPEADIRPPE